MRTRSRTVCMYSQSASVCIHICIHSLFMFMLMSRYVEIGVHFHLFLYICHMCMLAHVYSHVFTGLMLVFRCIQCTFTVYTWNIQAERTASVQQCSALERLASTRNALTIHFADSAPLSRLRTSGTVCAACNVQLYSAHLNVSPSHTCRHMPGIVQRVEGR